MLIRNFKNKLHGSIWVTNIKIKSKKFKIINLKQIQIKEKINKKPKSLKV